MANAVIGSLRANLGLDSSKFQKGARGVRDPLRAMKTQFMAVAGAAAAFGTAITVAAIKGANQIDKLAKSARRVDGSIGGFRAIILAADEAGVAVSSLTSDVQTMNRELSRAGEGGPVDDALREMGLSAEHLLSLDIDERLAVIADRMLELGLSSGKATAILQDFGVRNREMALLMIQGGAAIRDARSDVDDYGLALGAVDSAKIEKANDQISRLSIVSEYFGQQLALVVVPALGNLAEAFTNSMREGGLLRGMIDGFANNLLRVSTYIATAVGLLGVRLVGAMVSAAVATGGLSAALLVLRGAIIRTGFGALIIGAGELIYQFGQLVERAGGFGSALGLLKNVAVEVWDRIKVGGQSMADGLSSVFARIKAGWLAVLAGMQKSWAGFLSSVTRGLSNVPGMDSVMLDVGNAAIMAGSAWVEMREEAEGAKDAADGLVASSRELAAAAAAPLKSLQALRDAATPDGGNDGQTQDSEEGGGGVGQQSQALQSLLDRIDPTRVSMRGLAEDTAMLDAALAAGSITLQQYNDAVAALPDLYDGAASAGGGAVKATEQLTEALGDMPDAVSEINTATDGLSNTFASTFADIFSGTKTVMGGLSQLAGQLARMAMMEGFKGLFKNLLGGLSGGGSGLADLFGFNADGTDNWRGGMSVVGERGPEIVNLPRGAQVLNAQKSAEMMVGKPQAAPSVTVSPKIINLFDMSVVGEWMSGPAGEEIILNHMARNGYSGA